MKTFRFQGYSDDTFGEYEQTNDDYDNCSSGEPIRYSLLTPEGHGVIVVGLYGNLINDGQDGWMIGVSVVNEEQGVDDWEFTMQPSHEGYRNNLIVIAPDTAELKCLNREPE